MIEVAWGAETHAGNRRPANEDAFVAQPPVFAVADGMGGHAGGSLASRIAVGALQGLVERFDITRLDVLDAVRAADDEILRRSETGEAPGMGTTLTGLALTSRSAEHLVVFNVGDSRSYQLRDGGLVQISHDHSVVQELIDDGSITQVEAGRHPERHVITRSLGSGEHLDIDWWTVEPRVGDRYLLCSDGLTKELEFERIRDILSREPDAGAAAGRLVNEALANGGRDNVTVVVVDLLTVEVPAHTEDPLEAETNPRSRPALDPSRR